MDRGTDLPTSVLSDIHREVGPLESHGFKECSVRLKIPVHRVVFDVLESTESEVSVVIVRLYGSQFRQCTPSSVSPTLICLGWRTTLLTVS